MSGLDKFIEKISKDGVALKSRYRVDFAIPPIMFNEDVPTDLQSLTLYCNMTTLPKVMLNTGEIKTYGPTRQYVHSRNSGESVPFIFYIDEKMNIKRFFEMWVNKIHSLTNFHLSYYDEYATDITITQLDLGGNDVYSCVLIGAFPKTLNDMELSSDSQSRPHTLDVDMSFWYWSPVDMRTGMRTDEIVPITEVPYLLTTTPGIDIDRIIYENTQLIGSDLVGITNNLTNPFPQ